MQKGKIAVMCTSGSLGGLELNALKSCHWFRQMGFDSLLVASPGTPLVEKAETEGVEVRYLPKPWKYGDVTAGLRLARLMKREKLKNLVVHFMPDLSVAGIAKRLSGNSFVLVYRQQMALGLDKKNIFHRIRLGRLDAWASPLPYLASEAASRTHVPKNKIHLVPLGLELAQFAAVRGKQREAREKLGLPQHVFVAGLVGRLDPAKGQDTLLRAAGILKKKDMPIHLLFVGEATKGLKTDYLQHLKNMAIGFGLEAQTHFRAFTPGPEWAFACMDVAVTASLSETYGMVTLEAHATGVPVAGAKAQGTAHLVVDGVNGLHFPPNDPEALANTLLALWQDPVLRNSLANKAVTTVEAYSHLQECGQLVAILQQLGGL